MLSCRWHRKGQSFQSCSVLQALCWEHWEHRVAMYEGNDGGGLRKGVEFTHVHVSQVLGCPCLAPCERRLYPPIPYPLFPPYLFTSLPYQTCTPCRATTPGGRSGTTLTITGPRLCRRAVAPWECSSWRTGRTFTGYRTSTRRCRSSCWQFRCAFCVVIHYFIN